MFLGEYEYKVDNKGRLPLPPKFRQELRGELVLTKGLEKCIVVYPAEEWHKIADTLSSRVVPSSKFRTMNRAMFGTAFSLSLDGQGRIALPSLLHSAAEIGDTAIVVGANNCIEIWNPILWDSEKTKAEEQLWQIIESLEEQR
ncbi:MAG: division/cell wall cluster transcriptional repressor MraZ [Chloroflexi bacterium RBG_19FT_COMBO_48_23]|nr:MAG: division/cell wall cluster transcriptional repressor MraZ [Chloroflexi bacterium RBG_19FT_COMBO_48_23]